MAFSLSNLLKEIEGGLTAIGNIGVAVSNMKATGATKSSALSKVVTITEIAACAAEAVPIPQVSAIGVIVATVVEDVFGAAPTPATPPPSTPPTP